MLFGVALLTERTMDGSPRRLPAAERRQGTVFDFLVPRSVAALVDRPARAIPLALLLIVVIAAVDYVTTYEARLAILYFIPVALATSTCGRRWGVLIAGLSVIAWGIAFESQHVYSNPAFFYWDCIVLAVTLLLFVELLARLRVALARSDERFVRVLSGLHAAVFVTDDEHVLFANDWLVRLLGRDRMPTVADIGVRFPITASGTDGLADTPAHLPFTGSEVRDPVDGRWYLAQAGAITWIDGRRVRLTVLTDVTEQKRVEALSREHQASLHHTARLVNLAEAATTLAHELNQPLLAIVGYNAACLRLLDAGVNEPGELAEAMEKCRVQAVRAGDILQRIRDLTRRRAPTLTACDFNAMLREVLTWVQDDLHRAGVRVDLSLAEILPSVRADRILVEQVMLNLVNNAVESMHAVPPARRQLALATAADPRGSIQVTVGDRGTGIAPDQEPRLFTPFFTTKERGLGLGLAICRSVVELHGGRLWHDKRPEGGTAFHFSLPTGAV